MSMPFAFKGRGCGSCIDATHIQDQSMSEKISSVLSIIPGPQTLETIFHVQTHLLINKL